MIHNHPPSSPSLSSWTDAYPLLSISLFFFFLFFTYYYHHFYFVTWNVSCSSRSGFKLSYHVSISFHLYTLTSLPTTGNTFPNFGLLADQLLVLQLQMQAPLDIYSTDGHQQPSDEPRDLTWPDLVPVNPQGVDLWSLDYVSNPLLDQLVCSICQCVLVDPYSTKCG